MVKWYESADAIVFGTPALLCAVCLIAKPCWRMALVTTLFWLLFAGGLVCRYYREKRRQQ